MSIILSLPPSINRAYKTTRQGGFYKSAECKLWERTAGYELMAQKPPHDLTGPIYVGVVIYISRDRDCDSGIKPILDLLQKQSIYANDSQVVHINMKKYKVKKGEERCEIEVHQTYSL